MHRFLAAAKKMFRNPKFKKNSKVMIESFFCDSKLVPKIYKDCAANFESSAFVQNAFDILRMMTLPDDEDSLCFLVDRSKIRREDHSSSEGDSENSDEEDSETLKKDFKKPVVASPTKKPKLSTMSTSEQLKHLSCYKRQFERVWLMLLSLPLTAGQHKLVLKHLPQHVIPILPRPLLVADYLTKSYDEGGFVSVLALGKFILTYL